MKNSMKWIMMGLLMLGAMAVSAQQSVKLGHIESEKLISVMPEMIAARKTLEAKQAEIEKENANLMEQRQAKIADYVQNSASYSDVIRTSKEQEIQELNQRIERFQEITTNEFRKSQEDLLRPIYEKATKAIQEVGKENGFTYVFDLNAGGVLYHAENAHDIMPLVKKKLGIQE